MNCYIGIKDDFLLIAYALFKWIAINLTDYENWLYQKHIHRSETMGSRPIVSDFDCFCFSLLDLPK